MEGVRWENAVQGSKDIINVFQSRHNKASDVKVLVIAFSGVARIIWNDSLDKKIPDHLWKCHKGFTHYGPPLIKAFEVMNEIIQHYEYAYMCFYTDGNANYEEEDMETIEHLLRRKESDWRVTDKP